MQSSYCLALAFRWNSGSRGVAIRHRGWSGGGSSAISFFFGAQYQVLSNSSRTSLPCTPYTWSVSTNLSALPSTLLFRLRLYFATPAGLCSTVILCDVPRCCFIVWLPQFYVNTTANSPSLFFPFAIASFPSVFPFFWLHFSLCWTGYFPFAFIWSCFSFSSCSLYVWLCLSD